MRGTAGHDIVEHAMTALRNLDHRGATGADPATGDGAGILTQMPDRFLRESAGLDLPPRGQLRRRLAFLPTDPASRSWAVQQVEAIAAEEGLAILGWRDVPVGRGARRSGRPGLHAALRPAHRRRRRWAGAAFRHRAGPAGLLPAQAGRARGRPLLRVAVGPDAGLQGHAHDRAARAVLPRPVRPRLRDRAGARPLALLDQHLPVLEAGPPVPADRAQRRDQHRQGQPQLDALPREPALQPS